MIAPLATAVIAAALVMAGWTGLLALLNRRGGRIVLGALAAVELLVLAQLGTAVALVIGGSRPAGNTVEFFGYHLATLLVLPAAVVWSVTERSSRWAAGVLTIGCLAVAVMTVRMNQIWV